MKAWPGTRLSTCESAKMVCLTMVQVTNVSPTATTQQMKELFSYMGDIVEIKVYPDDTEA